MGAYSAVSPEVVSTAVGFRYSCYVVVVVLVLLWVVFVVVLFFGGGGGGGGGGSDGGVGGRGGVVGGGGGGDVSGGFGGFGVGAVVTVLTVKLRICSRDIDPAHHHPGSVPTLLGDPETATSSISYG